MSPNPKPGQPVSLVCSNETCPRLKQCSARKPKPGHRVEWFYGQLPACGRGGEHGT